MDAPLNKFTSQHIPRASLGMPCWGENIRGRVVLPKMMSVNLITLYVPMFYMWTSPVRACGIRMHATNTVRMGLTSEDYGDFNLKSRALYPTYQHITTYSTFVTVSDQHCSFVYPNGLISWPTLSRDDLLTFPQRPIPVGVIETSIVSKCDFWEASFYPCRWIRGPTTTLHLLLIYTTVVCGYLYGGT